MANKLYWKIDKVDVYLNYIGSFDVPDTRTEEEIEAERSPTGAPTATFGLAQRSQKRVAEVSAEVEQSEIRLGELEKLAEKKEKRLDKLDEQISVKEKAKAKATIAEVEAMGHSIPLIPGVHFTDDEAKKLKTLAKKSVTIQDHNAEWK